MDFFWDCRKKQKEPNAATPFLTPEMTMIKKTATKTTKRRKTDVPYAVRRSVLQVCIEFF